MSHRARENTSSGLKASLGGALSMFGVYWATDMQYQISLLWTDYSHLDHIFKYCVTSGFFTGIIGGFLRDRASPIQDEVITQPVRRPTVPQQVPVNPSSPVLPDPEIEIFEEPIIDIDQLYKDLKRDEGIRNVIYKDSLGFPTAGIGHKILPDEPEYELPIGSKVGIERVREWFLSDTEEAIENVQVLFPDLADYPMEIRLVLTNMIFQLGYTGLSKFKQTIRYIENHQWGKAATEMLDSKWRTQTPTRAKRHSERFKAVARSHA